MSRATGVRRRRPAVLLVGAVLLACGLAPTSAAAAPVRHASAVATSRWWKLACGEAPRSAAAKPPACTLTVRLRGPIDRSRQRLLEAALRRRDDAARALGRDVAIRVDVDSPGGAIFAALEIGRILRSERARIRVASDATCTSACVFVLMGATERRIEPGARIGIHRPSLGDPRANGLVDAMAAALARYAEQMGVSRAIVDAMLAIPADRVRYLGAADLAGYGLVAAPEVPAMQLAQRVESEFARRPDAFANDPGHQSLVFPVSQPQLLTFMRQIRVFGEPGALVLGTANGFESHGAGLLDLLFTTWRPEGRVPRLDDAFWFEANRARLPLAALYASHRNQVFLPVPGVATDAIHGALPKQPQLPRVLFRVPGPAPVETDAYHLLLLLSAHEPDLSATWTNALGQPLSAALLLDNARDFYLSSTDTPAEPADHSKLHLVDVLLHASRRRHEDPDAIKRHFLNVELRREHFEPADATLLLAHYTESLGLLLADPRTRWSAAERSQVRGWLERLDGRFASLDKEESRRLAHLLRGLRLVHEHADRLRDDLPGAQPRDARLRQARGHALSGA